MVWKVKQSCLKRYNWNHWNLVFGGYLPFLCQRSPAGSPSPAASSTGCGTCWGESPPPWPSSPRSPNTTQVEFKCTEDWNWSFRGMFPQSLLNSWAGSFTLLNHYSTYRFWNHSHDSDTSLKTEVWKKRSSSDPLRSVWIILIWPNCIIWPKTQYSQQSLASCTC